MTKKEVDRLKIWSKTHNITNAFVLIHYPNCKKCIKKDTL